MLANSAYDFWAYAQNRRYNTFAFRGAQMDAYGNVNNTTIGPYESPKVRLPGGGGMADLSCMIPLIYLWSTTHDPRTFVEKLDFRSGIGWGDGGDHRERLGLPGGPQLCVTNLCVFDFHPDSKRMQIRSLHPGVTAEQVIEATGFELAGSPDGDLARDRRADRGGAADPARGRRPDRRPPAGVPMSQTATAIPGPEEAVGATDVIEADAPAIRELADRIAGEAEGAEAARLLFEWVRDEIRLRHGARRRGPRGLARDRDARARPGLLPAEGGAARGAPAGA